MNVPAKMEAVFGYLGGWGLGNTSHPDTWNTLFDCELSPHSEQRTTLLLCGVDKECAVPLTLDMLRVHHAGPCPCFQQVRAGVVEPDDGQAERQPS